MENPIATSSICLSSFPHQDAWRSGTYTERLHYGQGGTAFHISAEPVESDC